MISNCSLTCNGWCTPASTFLLEGIVHWHWCSKHPTKCGADGCRSTFEEVTMLMIVVVVLARHDRCACDRRPHRGRTSAVQGLCACSHRDRAICRAQFCLLRPAKKAPFRCRHQVSKFRPPIPLYSTHAFHAWHAGLLSLPHRAITHRTVEVYVDAEDQPDLQLSLAAGESKLMHWASIRAARV